MLDAYVEKIKSYLVAATKSLDYATKCEYINQLILADKWKSNAKTNGKSNYDYLSGNVMRTLYYNIMLENMSLFFYKCDDSIYILEYYSK